MDEQQLKRHSKFLSLVLRHKPEVLGITLDENGWTDVATLLDRMHQEGRPLDLETLALVVSTNSKQRFALSDDHTRIRANQGHSVAVELGYVPVEPPAILFHGTGHQSVENILLSGLEKRSRHHVHLSADRQTAVLVGQRHGKPVVLEVLAGDMHLAGFAFFLSENGVWLTDQVPPPYLRRA